MHTYYIHLEGYFIFLFIRYFYYKLKISIKTEDLWELFLLSYPPPPWDGSLSGWLQKSRKKKLPDFSLISLSAFFRFPWFSSLIIYRRPNFSETFWFFSYLSKNTFQNFVCNCATYSTNLTWTFLSSGKNEE